MKHLLFIIATIILYLSASQGRCQSASLGIHFYDDKVTYSPKKPEFEVNDFLSDNDQFMRLSGQLTRGNHTFLTWIDLDIGLNPQNGLIGYRKFLSDQSFYYEGLIRRMKYYINYEDNFYPNNDYLRYIKSLQPGLGIGYFQKWGIVEADINPRVFISLKNRTELEYLDTNSSNFRGIDSYEIQLKNFISLNMRSAVSLVLIDAKSIDVLLNYRLIWRLDWFNFYSEYDRYEWTRANRTQSYVIDLKQTATSFQHHVGLVLRFSKN